MKPTLLIADDEPKFVDNFKEILLMSFDCNILVHSSSIGAMETIKKEHVHILFQDIHMPDVIGFEVVKEIKRMGKDLTIYLMTSWEEDAYPIKSADLGVFYLRKPIVPKHLIEQLTKIFDKEGLEYKKK